MFKAPEFWYLLLLTATLVAYAVGCFYYYNHGTTTRLATLYFGYVVYTAVIIRVLFARWQQHDSARPFAAKSLLLLGAGLLPLLLVGLGVGKV